MIIYEMCLLFISVICVRLLLVPTAILLNFSKYLAMYIPHFAANRPARPLLEVPFCTNQNRRRQEGGREEKAPQATFDLLLAVEVERLNPSRSLHPHVAGEETKDSQLLDSSFVVYGGNSSSLQSEPISDMELLLHRSSRMASSSAPFVIPRGMDMYGTDHPIGMWRESTNANNISDVGPAAVVDSVVKMNRNLEDISSESAGPSTPNGRASNRTAEKVLRRLAQNREAARKSRLKKKAYVQQLELYRVKLSELERTLEGVKQQGVLVGGKPGNSSQLFRAVNPGVSAFETDYGSWIEEQNKQVGELRTALQQQASDIELQMLVENGINHYNNLFKMKAAAAKSDVFYILFGMWKTGAERCFLWLGGSRPSELLKVLTPHLDLLTEKQLDDVCSLQKSCQQAEDALLQGMERLQQTLSGTLSDPSGSSGVTNYMGQMAMAIGKLEALVSFVNQADHLRHQTLQMMRRILTTRQAARGLLALGDYFHCLRALSALWDARPHEHA